MINPADPPTAENGSDSYEITVTTSLPERRLFTLKHGHSFGLFDPHGDIAAGPGSPEGLFHDDTRVLSGLRLYIDGHRPLLLSSTVKDNNSLLTVHLTNPEIIEEEDIRLPNDVIHLLRTKFVWEGRAFERLRVQNFGDREHHFSLAFTFRADFADLFEVRGHRRPRRGTIDSSTVGGCSVVWRYTALDGREHRTTLEFQPAPDQLETGRARYHLTLPPRGRTSLFVTCTSRHGEEMTGDVPPFLPCLRDARRAQRRAASRAASIRTSNEIFNEVLSRSMSDLYMLVTETEDGPYPYAGVPWYNTVFGRDGIITAIQMLWIDPGIARGVLSFLAARQARHVDPKADAEPGKILHEMRLGEMARLGEVPFRLYYGSVDSTPLFVMLVGLYHERTGDLGLVRRLWPAIEAALGWIDRHGDLDGDGLVEYARKDVAGLLNQGWKDSHDSVFHEDGQMAPLPIALCEVQGYVYAAKRHAARLSHALGDAARAAALQAEAERLREAIERDFWMEDRGFYALALDRDKRPCRVRSSNAGHLLFCGVPSQERAARVAAALCGPSFFSGWGVRTIASSEPRYNPVSYHNGSIWPHDNALIALGLARYDLDAAVGRIFAGLFDTAAYMELRRLPELFCGFRRQPGTGPTTYPVACAPQAWASATPFALLQASLGIGFDAKQNEIRFHCPRLPAFLDELTIRSLRLGEARADILLRRYGDDVSVNVIDRSGDFAVTVTY